MHKIIEYPIENGIFTKLIMLIFLFLIEHGTAKTDEYIDEIFTKPRPINYLKFDEDTNITIINCSFKSIYYRDGGAAIYIDNGPKIYSTRLTIFGSKFLDIYGEFIASTIYDSCVFCEIESCDFTNCSGPTGGVILFCNEFVLIDCNILRCYSSENMFIYYTNDASSFLVKNCNFDFCDGININLRYSADAFNIIQEFIDCSFTNIKTLKKDEFFYDQRGPIVLYLYYSKLEFIHIINILGCIFEKSIPDMTYEGAVNSQIYISIESELNYKVNISNSQTRRSKFINQPDEESCLNFKILIAKLDLYLTADFNNLSKLFDMKYMRGGINNCVIKDCIIEDCYPVDSHEINFQGSLAIDGLLISSSDKLIFISEMISIKDLKIESNDDTRIEFRSNLITIDDMIINQTSNGTHLIPLAINSKNCSIIDSYFIGTNHQSIEFNGTLELANTTFENIYGCSISFHGNSKLILIRNSNCFMNLDFDSCFCSSNQLDIFDQYDNNISSFTNMNNRCQPSASFTPSNQFSHSGYFDASDMLSISNSFTLSSNTSDDKKSNVIMIVGIVTGCIVFIAIVTTIAIIIIKKSDKTHKIDKSYKSAEIFDL